MIFVHEPPNPTLVTIYDFFLNFLFILHEQEYLDLFEYLIISSGVCSPFIPLTSGHYKEESLGGGLKMVARDFNPRIS